MRSRRLCSRTPARPLCSRRSCCTKGEPQRRHTLIGRRFATTYPDGSTELRELTGNELTDVLRNTFGIALEAEETEFLKQRSRLGDEASKDRSERTRST